MYPRRAARGLTIQTTAFQGKDCGYGTDRASTDYKLAYVTEDATASTSSGS